MEALLPLILKGISVAQVVWENRDLALSAINSVKNIITSHKAGKVTQAEIDATEKELDALLAEFNAPLPPE